MKRLLKKLWGLTGPLRRPVRARLAGFVTGCVAQALDERNLSRAMTDELTLLLDTLVAEQVRLQERVEALEELTREALERRDVVAETDPFAG